MEEEKRKRKSQPKEKKKIGGKRGKDIMVFNAHGDDDVIITLSD